MRTLYSSSGAQDFELIEERYSSQAWEELSALLLRLLEARGSNDAIQLFNKFPWAVFEATNFFGDEFAVLFAKLPLTQYVDASNLEENAAARNAATQLAHALTEIVPEQAYIRHVAFALDTATSVMSIAPPEPVITSAVVERALEDAERLLRSGSAISAVDRMHTALVGYLRLVCRKAEITIDEKDGSGILLKKLVREHTSFRLEQHGDHILKMLRSAGAILDALDPIRNRASVAHANENLLDEPEAMLAINVARSILHYLDARLQ